jgi:hypothetical protein
VSTPEIPTSWKGIRLHKGSQTSYRSKPSARLQVCLYGLDGRNWVASSPEKVKNWGAVIRHPKDNVGWCQKGLYYNPLDALNAAHRDYLQRLAKRRREALKVLKDIERFEKAARKS